MMIKMLTAALMVMLKIPNKELPFSSVGEPLHDHGRIFA